MIAGNPMFDLVMLAATDGLMFIDACSQDAAELERG